MLISCRVASQAMASVSAKSKLRQVRRAAPTPRMRLYELALCAVQLFSEAGADGTLSYGDLNLQISGESRALLFDWVRASRPGML